MHNSNGIVLKPIYRAERSNFIREALIERLYLHTVVCSRLSEIVEMMSYVKTSSFFEKSEV
jgi:hypothetical protein